MNDRQTQQLTRKLDLAIGGPSDVPQRSSSPQAATYKASLMSLFDEPLPTFQLKVGAGVDAGPVDSAGAEVSFRPATPDRPNIFKPSFSAPPASPSLEKPPAFTAAGDAPIAPAAEAPARVSTSRCYVGPVLSHPLLAYPSEGIQLLSREMIRAYFISYVWMYTVDQEPYGSSGGELAESSPPTPPKAETGSVGLQAEQATAKVVDAPHLPVDVQLMKECLSEVLGR